MKMIEFEQMNEHKINNKKECIQDEKNSKV
jgi:hypothetical protein